MFNLLNFDEVDNHNNTASFCKGLMLTDSNFSQSPFLALDYKDVFRVSNNSKCNYTQGCKWAPDGSCLLVASDDKKLRFFSLSPNVARGEFSDESWITNGWRKDIQPAVTVKEADNIYDYQWYPCMQSEDLSTCCVAATCHNLPVHLWNTRTGQLTCSYLHYNHLDMMIHAHSLGFSPDGSKLVAGYAKNIQEFDVSRPGRYSSSLSSQGQSGIISTIAFHPELRHIFAAGSYSSSVGLYSLKTRRVFVLFEGHRKGVTYVRFSSDGTRLFSGTRKDDEILCWDIRNPGKMLAVLSRGQTTNQRMYFDLTPAAARQCLLSGTTDGQVLVWNLSESPSEWNGEVVPPESSFAAHEDCVNGVSVHPFRPLVATSSGQRVLPHPEDAAGSDSEGESDAAVTVAKSEVSAKLWWVG